MIGPTRGARQLAAALVAVLLAGAVGLAVAVSGSRSESQARAAVTAADAPAGHHQATVVAPSTDDPAAALDLAAAPLELLALAAIGVVAAHAVALTGRPGSSLITVTGRAPPRA